VFLIVVALVALIALAVWPRKQAQVVRVAPARRMAQLDAIVNGTGEIRTKDSVDIQAEIAGVIVELPVREGDVVQKHQVLLKIDPFQTSTDVQTTRAALSALEAEAKGQVSQIASSEANAARSAFLKKSAEVELRQAEANLTRAKLLFEREKRLLEEKVISPDDFEVTETQFTVQKAQVEAAQAKIQQLEAEIRAAQANIEYAKAAGEAIDQRIEGARSGLERTEDLLRKTTIRSPLDGVIVKLNVEVGERAVPGIQSNPIATLMTIADLNVIEAELKVDETDIVNVKMDDRAKVVVDAIPDAPLAGVVNEIGNSPITSVSSSSQEGKDFKVVLRIENPPGTLRPGMSCEADMTTAVRKDVLVIPIQSLTAREVEVDPEGKYVPPRPDESVGSGQLAAASAATDKPRKELQGVFLVGQEGRAHFRPVKTGILGEVDVEVLEGVSLGEEVVVGPLKALRTLEESSPVVVDRTKPFRHSVRARARSSTSESGEEE